MLKIKFFLFIFLILLNNKTNSQKYSEQTETCDGSSESCSMSNTKIEKDMHKKSLNKEKIKKAEKIEKKEEKKIIHKKLIYSDIFENQPLSITRNETSSDDTSTFFDFRINRKISKYVNENGIAPYPRERFINKQQGNFLHFLHLVYKKKLPLFFSVDQILYPYIEITKELQRTIMEKGLYNILHQFFNNIINYGKKGKYEQGILVYFSIALKFLNKKENVFQDEVCEKIINKILNLKKNDTNTLYTFTLLNNTRKIDKLKFEERFHILKGNDYLESISDCLRFLQNFQFVIEKELNIIYKIGDLIYKSGEEKTYIEIKNFIKYIFNEEENVMNPLDIYLFINNNNQNKSLINANINNLYETIKDKIIKNATFSFISNYSSIKKEEDNYKNRNSYVSLFSSSFNLDDYINYKLLNFKKLRFYPSFFEFADITHHNTYMRKTIYDRYKGNITSSKGKLFKFRDGIDISDEFNYIRKVIKQSMIDENENWIDSYENSFNYLLNIIGHIDKKMKKIDDIKIKTFNTLIGGYTHFKKDILLFEQSSNITYAKNGEIIDLYFDPQKKFYEEITKISKVFQNHLIHLINCINNNTTKIKLEKLIERKMKRLFISYENILRGIELQENKINNDERKKIKDTMFYYDKKKKKYQGWYVDLYKNQTGKVNYALNMYVHNFFNSKPISKVNYKGTIIYISMNFPEFGLISIEENDKESKKLFIFSSYTGNEYPLTWTNNVKFDGLKKLLLSRR